MEPCLDPIAVDYVVRPIHQVCCFTGAFDLLEEFLNAFRIVPLIQVKAKNGFCS
jgi:hypothetical protein